MVAAEPWRVMPHLFAEHCSGGRWKAYAYLRLMSQRIARAIVRGNGRLIVNLPPGHGKSSIVSHWLPTWYLDNLPGRRVIMASHGAELATHWGRTVRNEFENNERLTTKLRDDSSAADRWNTPQGGGMLCVGTGGGVTGFRGNLIIVDDPIPTWEEAQSRTRRERLADWFDGTLTDRGEPNATIVILMHRWHEQDLTGHLVSNRPELWDVIRLPALAEPGDPLGREVGAALCPERFDADALVAMRDSVGPLVWAAKYQQRPETFAIGRAYRNFEPTRNEDKSLALNPDLPLQLSFDFNVNPGVSCIIGQYDPKRDLFTAVQEIYGPRIKTRVTMEMVAKAIGNRRWPMVEVFGDRSGKTQNSATTKTDYAIIGQAIQDMGMRVSMRVPEANPPIKSRLEAFNDALCGATGEVHYKINPLLCPRLTRDLRLVKEDDDGLIDKSDSELTHMADAEGYRVNTLRPIRRTLERRPGAVILGGQR